MGTNLASLPHKPHLHILAIAANWTVMLVAAGTAMYFDNLLWTASAVILIGARQHALFVLVHEATHMHLSSNKRWNDGISNTFCAFPLFFDTEVYRRNHLAHHRHLNGPEDPDWMRKKGRWGWSFPIRARDLALGVPFFIAVLGPLELIPIFWGFSGFGDKKRWKSEPLFLIGKLAYFSAIAAGLYWAGLGQAYLLYWIVPMFFVLPFVARLRNFSEHFALNFSDDHNSTRETTPSWIEGFLLTPHNVNLHLTHHKYPYIPFYNLPEAHARLKASGEYDGAHINTSYFFPYENSVLKDALHCPPLSPDDAHARKSGKAA